MDRHGDSKSPASNDKTNRATSDKDGRGAKTRPFVVAPYGRVCADMARANTSWALDCGVLVGVFALDAVRGVGVRVWVPSRCRFSSSIMWFRP